MIAGSKFRRWAAGPAIAAVLLLSACGSSGAPAAYAASRILIRKARS